MRMLMRIRVTTRAHLYEKRKQEHIERGYRIEDERPIPVNGFCSFIAMRELPASDRLGDLVAEALNGNHARRGDWCGARCLSKSAFISMDAVHAIPGTTPSAMDIHLTGSVEDVSLCTPFTFTRRSLKEELTTQTSSSSEHQRIVKNTKPTMSNQALKLKMNHELSLPTI